MQKQSACAKVPSSYCHETDVFLFSLVSVSFLITSYFKFTNFSLLATNKEEPFSMQKSYFKNEETEYIIQ